MGEYKRLTERRGSLVIDKCGNCPNVNNPQGCTDKKCYEIMKNRLAELEDKIENGEIIFAPKYKLKQTVYWVIDKNTYLKGQIDMFNIYTQKYLVFIDKYYDNDDELGFGNEWYYENELLATEAEAEAKLKELQEV